MLKVITLLTDFGEKDHYVASMKGVILNIAGPVTLVDISHEVPKFNIRAAAYVLRCAYKYFPAGTIHLVVVDPGVGTERRALAIKTRRYFFVGPDNGVLIPAARDDGIVRAVSIENRRYMREAVSYTFHGRDIFAPAAAHLARGVPIEELGPEVDDYVVPEYAEPRVEDGEAEAEVIYIDGFGNCATNLREDDLARLGIKYGDKVELELGERRIVTRLLPSFGYARPGEVLLLINSEGFLEIAVNIGSATRELGVRTGTKVRVRALR